MAAGSDNCAIVRRWLDEVWNHRRDETVRELLDPGAVGHLEGLVTRGVDDFLAARSHLLNAFPDFHISIDAVMADGDHVAARWAVKGTHQGELLGMAPTGKPVAFRGMTWFVVRNGRIVEGWDVWNQGRVFGELRETA